MPVQVPACTTTVCTFTATYPQPPAPRRHSVTTAVQYQQPGRANIAVAEAEAAFQVSLLNEYCEPYKHLVSTSTCLHDFKCKLHDFTPRAKLCTTFADNAVLPFCRGVLMTPDPQHPASSVIRSCQGGPWSSCGDRHTATWPDPHIHRWDCCTKVVCLVWHTIRYPPQTPTLAACQLCLPVCIPYGL